MYQMTSVKKSVICSVCIALCYVLPMAFHAIGTGAVFSPMHIPVLLCGPICGAPYGLLSGLAGPAISCVLTGMPPVATLPVMMLELGLYGLVSGILMRFVRTGSVFADLYISLTVAVVIGRVAAGIGRAFLFTSGTYSMAAWVSGYLIGTWPGTLIQFVFIPTIIVSLMKSHLIPLRYPGRQDLPKYPQKNLSDTDSKRIG